MAKHHPQQPMNNVAPELPDTNIGTSEILSCDVSQMGMLTVFLGLQRLAVLISSGAKGFLLYRQTPEGLRLLGDYHATIPAALTALLHEVSW